MSKDDIVSEFVLNKTQVDKIDFYLSSVIKYNKHTNLVGKSTIENIWDRHVLDCLQLTKHITNKKLKILKTKDEIPNPGYTLSNDKITSYRPGPNLEPTNAILRG